MIGRSLRDLKARYERLTHRQRMLGGVALALVLGFGIGLSIFGARVTELRERHATRIALGS